jgi:RNA-splicing ligase RtcB
MLPGGYGYGSGQISAQKAAGNRAWANYWIIAKETRQK